ncbi:putative WD-repeat protein [Neospora caninum Liverpool]|nr:putative WD-repeat protein [Neospora caninum Liverpool]CBZ55688.1 putative WD-repeat protein [Neospora caninum Liverpool]|eukprot:XP_003885714.1 putative WD-repeat protein [Neospora caninum Liverpool]
MKRTGASGGRGSLLISQPFQSNALTYQHALGLPACDDPLRCLTGGQENSRENDPGRRSTKNPVARERVSDAFSGGRSAGPAALVDAFPNSLGNGHGGKRDGTSSATESENYVQTPRQLLRKRSTRRGVLSEAEMLDRLTNQKIAEIQYEFAARNGEVDVVEFIHILGRQLRDAEETEVDCVAGAPRNKNTLEGVSSLSCLPGPAQILLGGGSVAAGGMVSASCTEALGSEGGDCDTASGFYAKGLSARSRRLSVTRAKDERAEGLSLFGDSDLDLDAEGGRIRGRGSISHDTIQRELEEAGRLMELFDLIDVDDTQKVSWEAFTTFVVDRGRNGDALKRLHMQRLEKADFHDTRVHVCAIERLTTAYDPSIGLDVVFYYEEGSKTVELVDPLLKPIQNQPPLQRTFNITAVAYCPLVHHLVVAAADLSLTFYDLKGTLVCQDSNDFRIPSPSTQARGPRSGSPSASASRGNATDSPGAQSSPFWRVTRTFKTRTSQIVLFPSSSRPWIFSADHEGSIYAWDLEKICGGSLGASTSSRVALSADPLADTGGENPQSRVVSEARAIDLATLVPPSKSDGIRPLYLRRLASSSSPGVLSWTRVGAPSSGGISPYTDSARGRSDHASGRSSYRALSSGGNFGWVRGIKSGDCVPGTPGAARSQSPASLQPRSGRRSASTQLERNRGASLVREISASDGVSLFDSFANESRPSIALGSRHQRKASRERANSLAANGEAGGPSDSRPRSPQEAFSQSRPPSEASESDRSGVLVSQSSAGSPHCQPLCSDDRTAQRGSNLSSLCATNRSRKEGVFASTSGCRRRVRQSPGYVCSTNSGGQFGPSGGARCQTGETSPSTKAQSSSPRGALRLLYHQSRATGSSGSASRSSSQAFQPSPSGGGPSRGASVSSPSNTDLLSRRLGHSGGGAEASVPAPQEPQFQFLCWRQYRAHGDIVTAFEELEVMDLLASCGMDAKIYLWDAESGELKRSLDGHVRGVRALCFDVENRVLLSGGFDYKLLAWNPYVGKKLHTVRGHSAPVVSICMLGPQSRQFVSFDSEGIVKAWDLSTSACLQTLVTEDQSCVRAVIALPYHRTLVSAGRKLVALKYGLIQESTSAGSGRGARNDFQPAWGGKSPVRHRSQHTLFGKTSLGLKGRGAQLDEGGSPESSAEPLLAKAVAHLVVRVLVTAAGKHLRVWDLCTGALVSSIEHVCQGDHCISDICMDEKGRKVFVADQQGCICAYSVCTGQLLQRFSSHRSEVSQLLYVGGEDKNLISVSWDRSIVIHNDAPVSPPKKARGGCLTAGEWEGAAALPCTPSVAVGSPQSSGGLAAVPPEPTRAGEEDASGTCALPADRPKSEPRMAVEGSPGRTCSSWRSFVGSGGRRVPRAPSRGLVVGYRSDLDKGGSPPHGTRHASSEDPALSTLARAGAVPADSPQARGEGRIWRKVKNAHLGDVTCCAFSRRLGMLATGGTDRAIFVWDYERLRRVTSLFGHRHELANVSFIEPLPLLCSADVGGTLCIWVLPPHPHALRVLETVPSPALGPHPAPPGPAHVMGTGSSSRRASDPPGAGDGLGGGAGLPGGRSREAWKERRGVTWQPTEPGLSGHRRLSTEGPSKGTARAGGTGTAAGSLHAVSLPPHVYPGLSRDSSDAVRLSSGDGRVASPLGHTSRDGQRGSPVLRAPNGVGEASEVPNAPASANASAPPSSGPAVDSRVRGLPVTLLLLRIVDMERVGTTTPLTALAVACRMPAASGASEGRCLRFANSAIATCSPPHGEGTDLLSPASTSQSATGSGQAGLTRKLSPPPSLQGGMQRRTSRGQEDTTDIPGVPHSTTFLTSNDGSEPPASRLDDTSTASDAILATGASRVRQPCSNPSGNDAPREDTSSPSLSFLRSHSEELGSVGEILIFAGDERGRVRVWDVSVILALLPGTEQVMPKTDWQPHRVYCDDLRDSTMGLFKQMVPLHRVAKLPFYALPKPTDSNAATMQTRGRWPESPPCLPSRLATSKAALVEERERLDSGSAARGEDRELAAGWPQTRPASPEAVDPAWVGREGTSSLAQNRVRISSADAPTNGNALALPSRPARGSPDSRPPSRPLAPIVARVRDERGVTPTVQGAARSSTRPDARETDPGDTAGSSLARYPSSEPLTTQRRNSVRAPGAGALGLPDRSSSVTARLSGGPGSGVGGADSVDVSPYFGCNWSGEPAATMDPFLPTDEAPALFPRAPVKLVGMWKAHRGSVKSLQVLPLGNSSLQRNARSAHSGRVRTSPSGASDEELGSVNPQSAPSRRGRPPPVKTLLVSAGEDGAARIWDVSALSRSEEPPRRTLPTMFLDLAQERHSAPMRGAGLKPAHGPSFAHYPSLPAPSREAGVDGDVRDSALAPTPAARNSPLRLQTHGSVPALPPSRSPRSGDKDSRAGCPRSTEAGGTWPDAEERGAWAVPSSDSSCASGASNFRVGTLSRGSTPWRAGRGGALGGPDQSVVLVGDLQAQASAFQGEAGRGSDAYGEPPAVGLTVGCATLWDIDFAELDGAPGVGNGSGAPPVGARRLLETHLRVKELARQQQLKEEQAAVQLERSLQFEVPHLLLPRGGKDPSEEGEARRGRDGGGDSRKTLQKDALPEEYAIGPNGQFILGGGNWVKGGDKGGGIWAAVYAKRRSLMDRTASF